MPPENPKIFISYTWADRDIVWPLAESLRVKGLEVWIDKREIRPGDRITEQVQKALVECDALLLMWSQSSSLSDYVRDEWNAALAQKRIIPCLLDGTAILGKLSDVLYVDLRDRAKGVEELLRILPPPVHRVREHDDTRRGDDGLQIENIPYRENPNFTGRQEDLAELRRTLVAGKTAAITQPVSISGLGGVGKTQLAIQYVYLYRDDYELIWWLRAEGPLTLAADYAALAERLDLPERHEREQELIVAAVRKWLEENRDWLLIFDNAPTPEVVRHFLPRQLTGHVLMTSRNQNWRELASGIPLREWPRDESVEFLLKRTTQRDAAMADAVANLLGDLPLALEQAGAYIEATGSSFSDYVDLFQEYRRELLRRFKPYDYPDTVATTWEISMRKVKERSPSAEALLNVCAFLAPDDIPRTLLRDGIKNSPAAVTLSFADPIIFDEAISALRNYSLIEATSAALSVHRLVQAVTRDRLSDESRKTWAETAVRLVANVFPVDSYDVRNWPTCARLLPHALVVTEHADNYQVDLDEVIFLFNRPGGYLHSRASYLDAEPLLRRALEVAEKYGSDHPYVATHLNNLAGLLKEQGKYTEAEPLFRRALAIREEQLGPEHPDVAASLNNLAALLYALAKYTDAEPLLRRTLEICEQQLRPEYPVVATSLNNLAQLLEAQGNYVDAEPLVRRALEIREKQLGPEHPDVAMSLHNLASLLQTQGKYADAELVYRRALEILKKQLGPEHPNVASSLNNLAGLLESQGKYIEAEQFARRGLAIREKQFGSEHPDVAASLNRLGGLLKAQGKYVEAESLYRRSLALREKLLGPEHTKVALVLNNLAELLSEKGNYAESELLHNRSLKIREKQLGLEHPDAAQSLNNLAELLRAQGKYADAEPLYRRALKICEKQLGSNHPLTKTVCENLESLQKQLH